MLIFFLSTLHLFQTSEKLSGQEVVKGVTQGQRLSLRILGITQQVSRLESPLMPQLN